MQGNPGRAHFVKEQTQMSRVSHRKRDGRVESVIHEQQRRLGVGGHVPFALLDEAGAKIPNRHRRPIRVRD